MNFLFDLLAFLFRIVNTLLSLIGLGQVSYRAPPKREPKREPKSESKSEPKSDHA